MLCRDVKRVVYFFLDGSLGERRKHDFDSHLRLCPECHSRMMFHQRLREFFRGRIQRLSLTAPARLKMRLTRSLRAFGTEWSR
ncbi:MAG TPA: zf-HC2 domain-containing protein [Thermoanaerobaculia bacterium]|nr:zf-HC2 domain-containing protein [Thermoanaerobaculia bacterium]